MMKGTQGSKAEGPKLSVTIEIDILARNQPEGRRFLVKLKGVGKLRTRKTHLCSLCMTYVAEETCVSS